MQNEADVMEEKLRALIEAAKAVKMTPEEQEIQRRSFAYGNTSMENGRITRDTIDKAADDLKSVGD